MSLGVCLQKSAQVAPSPTPNKSLLYWYSTRSCQPKECLQGEKKHCHKLTVVYAFGIEMLHIAMAGLHETI